MAATVSVSCPARTAACRPRCRCMAEPSPRSVVVIAAQASCSAVTVKPLLPNRPGSAPVAASIQSPHRPTLAALTRSSPAARSRRRFGDGYPDRLRPQHGGVPGERVGVGQQGDGSGGPRGRVAILERRQPDDGRAHQGPVPGRQPGPRVQGLAGAGQAVVRCAREVLRLRQDGPRLGPHVGGAAVEPRREGLGHGVQALGRGEVDALGRHPSHTECHLRVVAPLARLVRAEATALHHGLTDRWRGHLVGHAEGVAAGFTEQHPGRAVDSDGADRHGCSSMGWMTVSDGRGWRASGAAHRKTTVRRDPAGRAVQPSTPLRTARADPWRPRATP